MSVRAKFKVTSVTHNEYGHAIELSPVIGSSDENKAFYKQTPGGGIKLSTVNPEAAKEFEVGAEYYTDFTRAEPPAA